VCRAARRGRRGGERALLAAVDVLGAHRGHEVNVCGRPVRDEGLRPVRTRPRSVRVAVVRMPRRSEPPRLGERHRGEHRARQQGREGRPTDSGSLIRTRIAGARTEAMTRSRTAADAGDLLGTMQAMRLVPPAPPSAGGTPIERRPRSPMRGRMPERERCRCTRRRSRAGEVASGEVVRGRLQEALFLGEAVAHHDDATTVAARIARDVATGRPWGASSIRRRTEAQQQCNLMRR